MLWSKGQPLHQWGLAGIPAPPGSSASAAQCVRRKPFDQSYAVRIPLPSATAAFGYKLEHPVVWGERTKSSTDAGAVGITVKGVPIYPAPADDNGCYAWEQCEAGGCNAHVGVLRADYHYQGDPYGPGCLYTRQNYTDSSKKDPHTLQLGWAFDGFGIYGRYVDNSVLGYDVALDDCGGHEHVFAQVIGGTVVSGSRYHYHAEVVRRTGTSLPQCVVDSTAGDFFAFFWAPKNCYKGDVSKIKNFYLEDFGEFQKRFSPPGVASGAYASVGTGTGWLIRGSDTFLSSQSDQCHVGCCTVYVLTEKCLDINSCYHTESGPMLVGQAVR